MAEIIAAISAVVTAVAVIVAALQIRANSRGVDRTNSLPVISAAFNEFRFDEFQDHLRNVWFRRPEDVPEGGFQDLPDEWRTSAYTVAYFFEYLGVLVAYRLVPAGFVVDFAANMMSRSWYCLEPFIQAERRFREKHSGDGISAGFVTHFEHLVAVSVGPNGEPIDKDSHTELGLKSVKAGLFSKISYPTDGGNWRPPPQILEPRKSDEDAPQRDRPQRR